MAYEVTNPPVCLVPGVGGHPSLWVYKDTDAHATVSGADYFTNGAALGLKTNDVMIVVDTDTYTCTIHHMLTATDLSDATLS